MANTFLKGNMISNLISWVEQNTHVPILAISGVAISSPFIAQMSAVLGFITIVATTVAAVVTATIKVCELIRKWRKWNRENVDNKK